MLARQDDGFDDLGWQQHAACRGDHASVFYPPVHFERKDLRLARERLAKSICAQCGVKQACLAHALRTAELHGIWGGMNEAERRQLTDRQT